MTMVRPHIKEASVGGLTKFETWPSGGVPAAMPHSAESGIPLKLMMVILSLKKSKGVVEWKIRRGPRGRRWVVGETVGRK